MTFYHNFLIHNVKRIMLRVFHGNFVISPMCKICQNSGFLWLVFSLIRRVEYILFKESIFNRTSAQLLPYALFWSAFPAFEINTERYKVSFCIQSECGKMLTRITPKTDTFYAVVIICQYSSVHLEDQYLVI